MFFEVGVVASFWHSPELPAWVTGLDTCLAILRVLHDGLGESKYRPCPLLIQYVDAGWWGKKVGKGVYEYPGWNPMEVKPVPLARF